MGSMGRGVRLSSRSGKNHWDGALFDFSLRCAPHVLSLYACGARAAEKAKNHLRPVIFVGNNLRFGGVFLSAAIVLIDYESINFFF